MGKLTEKLMSWTHISYD